MMFNKLKKLLYGEPNIVGKDYSEIFDYDEKSKTCKVDLHYGDIEEVVDTTISNNKRMVISSNAIEYLLKIIVTIPKKIKVDVEYCFDNIRGCNPKEFLEAFNRSLRNRFHNIDKENKRRTILSILFVVTSLILIITSSTPIHIGIFEENDAAIDNVIKVVMDKLAELFVCEAVCILVLNYDRDQINNVVTFERFNSISIKDNNKTVLSSIDEKDIYKGWYSVDKKVRFADHIILFIGMYSAVSNTIELVGAMSGIFKINFIAVDAFMFGGILSLIDLVLIILYYLDNRFGRKYALAFFVFEIVLYIIYFVATFSTSTDRELIFMAFDFTLSLIGVIAFAYSKYHKDIIE